MKHRVPGAQLQRFDRCARPTNKTDESTAWSIDDTAVEQLLARLREWQPERGRRD